MKQHIFINLNEILKFDQLRTDRLIYDKQSSMTQDMYHVLFIIAEDPYEL